MKAKQVKDANLVACRRFLLFINMIFSEFDSFPLLYGFDYICVRGFKLWVSTFLREQPANERVIINFIDQQVFDKWPGLFRQTVQETIPSNEYKKKILKSRFHDQDQTRWMITAAV